MIKIAICEDNPSDEKRLQAHLRAWLEQHYIDYDLSSFADTESFLSAFSAGAFQLAFIDVYLAPNEPVGIRLAKQLTEADPDLKFIFCTSSPEFAAESYGMNASFYIVKPATRENMAQAMERISELWQKEMKIIRVMVNRKEVPVHLAEIQYAEVFGDQTVLHTKTAALTTRASLETIQQQVNQALDAKSTFLRCHKSYLVNLDAVQSTTEQGDFLMHDGSIVLVRTQNGRLAKSLLFDHLASRMRDRD